MYTNPSDLSSIKTAWVPLMSGKIFLIPVNKCWENKRNEERSISRPNLCLKCYYRPSSNRIGHFRTTSFPGSLFLYFGFRGREGLFSSLSLVPKEKKRDPGNAVDSPIVQEQKNRDKADKINFQLPLYKKRKTQICPLNLDFVLLFLHNSKVAHSKIASRWNY